MLTRKRAFKPQGKTNYFHKLVHCLHSRAQTGNIKAYIQQAGEDPAHQDVTEHHVQLIRRVRHIRLELALLVRLSITERAV